MSTTAIAFALALGVCCGGGAQIFPSEDDYARLLSTRSLRCSFGWYASVGWNADKPSLEISTQEDFRFQIDAIDPPGGRARMIGNVGAVDLILIPGADRLSFIERTPIGAISLTTVYAWRDSEGGFNIYGVAKTQAALG